MKLCSKCGFEAADEILICPQCGGDVMNEKVTAATDSKTDDFIHGSSDSLETSDSSDSANGSSGATASTLNETIRYCEKLISKYRSLGTKNNEVSSIDMTLKNKLNYTSKQYSIFHFLWPFLIAAFASFLSLWVVFQQYFALL